MTAENVLAMYENCLALIETQVNELRQAVEKLAAEEIAKLPNHAVCLLVLGSAPGVGRKDLCVFVPLSECAYAPFSSLREGMSPPEVRSMVFGSVASSILSRSESKAEALAECLMQLSAVVMVEKVLDGAPEGPAHD
jgi:hypothetical protein